MSKLKNISVELLDGSTMSGKLIFDLEQVYVVQTPDRKILLVSKGYVRSAKGIK